jgi:hypothetical protein
MEAKRLPACVSPARPSLPLGQRPQFSPVWPLRVPALSTPAHPIPRHCSSLRLNETANPSGVLSVRMRVSRSELSSTSNCSNGKVTRNVGSFCWRCTAAVTIPGNVMMRLVRHSIGNDNDAGRPVASSTSILMEEPSSAVSKRVNFRTSIPAPMMASNLQTESLYRPEKSPRIPVRG